MRFTAEKNLEFRVLLDYEIPTPPPQVTVQLAQELHVAQEESTAGEELSYLSYS